MIVVEYISYLNKRDKLQVCDYLTTRIIKMCILTVIMRCFDFTRQVHKCDRNLKNTDITFSAETLP